MMKNFVRAASVAAALCLGVTANASAATINLTTGNNEFDIEWLHPVQPLEAAAHFTATVTNTFIDFTVAISNLSPAVGSGIQSFGFNINPDPTSFSVTTAGSTFTERGPRTEPAQHRQQHRCLHLCCERLFGGRAALKSRRRGL